MSLTHPSREELIDYAYGWLAAERAGVIAGHLKICPFCALDQVLANDYLDLFAQPEPASLRQTVTRHLQRLLAVPITRPSIALAGQADSEAPLIFESGAIQIVLHRTINGDRHEVMGLVTGLEDNSLYARLISGQGDISEVTIDEAGHFVFESAPPTGLVVVIATLDLEIEVHVPAPTP